MPTYCVIPRREGLTLDTIADALKEGLGLPKNKDSEHVRPNCTLVEVDYSREKIAPGLPEWDIYKLLNGYGSQVLVLAQPVYQAYYRKAA